MIAELHAAALALLRARLADGEYTVRGLAKRAGLSQGFVCKVFAGRQSASAESLGLLLLAARISRASLVRTWLGESIDFEHLAL